MPQIPEGELIYRKWHEEVVSLIQKGELKEVAAKDRTLNYSVLKLINQFHARL